MGEPDDEMYADNLSDISQVTSDSSDDEDCGSEVTVKRITNLLRIDDTEECRNTSNEQGWLHNDQTVSTEKCMEESGLKVKLKKCTIKSITELFLGDDLMNLFVTETNRYTSQHQNETEEKKNKKWTDTNIIEMKKFLGLILLMELVKKTEKDDYWSTDPLICTPIFNKIMTRNRFRQIWRYWHFNNNENCQERLDKVRPVMEYLKTKFQMVYKPEKELSLSETVIPWVGKLFFRTYNPDKIIKYGILVRMVCEAVSGYVCNFEIYCAQGLQLQETIFSVLSPYLNLWHDVYLDSCFNSVTVTEGLLKNKTNVCGTIQQNRGVPNCLKNIYLNKNGSDFRRKDKILIQAYQPKKYPLYMISTIHSAKMVDVVHRKTKKTYERPVCLTEYNKYMKGIDRAHQCLSYNSIMLKTKKWTKKTVLYFINVALFNAHRVYVKSSKDNIPFKKFLLAVAKLWVEPDSEAEAEAEEGNDDSESGHDELGVEIPPAATAKVTKCDPVDRLCPEMRKHRIVRILGKGKVEHPRRACRVCTAAKKRSSTAYMCSSCIVPLHAGLCFESFHTKLKY